MRERVGTCAALARAHRDGRFGPFASGTAREVDEARWSSGKGTKVMEMAGTRRGLRASAVAALAFGLVALGTWGGEAKSSKEAMLLSFAGRACDLSAVLKLAAQEAGQALTSAPQLAGGRADGDASSAVRRLARARESMAAARAHEANATLARIEAWLDTVADAERALREHALLGELVKTQATLAAQHIDDFIYTFAKHSGDQRAQHRERRLPHRFRGQPRRKHLLGQCRQHTQSSERGHERHGCCCRD
ncbi:hypothetical protein ERJ75_001262500 [Trypanosoma vivax]|nr:hypothetical protein ERJ75_001262500 [Trypanosoma vivax]